MDKIGSIPITSWSEIDRPREKLIKEGRQVLTDAELVAILIGSGSQRESAVELSKRILNSVDNNLNELGKLTIHDLQKFNGIGEAKAISIVSALEIGRRRQDTNPVKRPVIKSSNDVNLIFSPILVDLKHEEFWALLLSRSNKVIKYVNISKGGVSGTVVDAKIVFKQALDNLASSIILCHNHPSGNLNPSEADKSLTKKLVEGGKTLDIPVLDHIIVTENGYFSFADSGLI